MLKIAKSYKKKNFSGAFPNIKEIFKQHFEKLTEN